MSSRYSDQFATLPPQLRSSQCWKLFITFCYFSGLPIAEGEKYYKVNNDTMKELRNQYGDIDEVNDIILSNEVMVTVNGEQSAAILCLPNIKTFRYLQKHYKKKCSRLNEKVFQRRN